MYTFLSTILFHFDSYILNINCVLTQSDLVGGSIMHITEATSANPSLPHRPLCPPLSTRRLLSAPVIHFLIVGSFKVILLDFT